MSLAFAAPLAVLAALALPSCARSRRAMRLVPIGILALGAIAALGSPELAGAHGFLLEPLRGWGVHALLVLVAASAAIRTLVGLRWGFVAAGVTLALLGGHAVVVLGGILAADLALATRAVPERPRTLHARIPVRDGALGLLASDAVLIAAFLLGSHRASEPLSIEAGALLVVAVGLRIAAAVLIDDAPPAAGALFVLPLLAPLGWVAGGNGWLTFVLTAGAAFAAWRWLRSGARTQSTLAVGLLAVAAASVPSPGTLVLAPLLLTAVVAFAILPDLFRGGALVAIGLTGAFALAGGDVLFGALAEQDGGLLRISGIAGIVALGALVLGALGPVRTTPDRDRSVPVRILVGIVTGGLFLLVAAWPARVARVVAPAIAAARLPEADVFGAEVPVSIAIPIALAAVVLLAVLLERTVPDRLPAPSPHPDHAAPIVPATTLPPPGAWGRAALAIAAVDAILLLVVLGRSITDGWL